MSATTPEPNEPNKGLALLFGLVTIAGAVYLIYWGVKLFTL